MRVENYDALRDLLFKKMSEAENTNNEVFDALMEVVKEARLEYDYKRYKEGTLADRKFEKEKLIKEQLKFFPNANTTVLAFIYDFYTKHGNDSSNMEYMRSTFRAGYCYYFAVMLKAAFERGKLCIAAPFDHVVWQDEDSMVYDVEGVYDGEADCFIPVEVFGDVIKDLKHVEGDVYDISKEKVTKIIEDYKKANGLS